MNSATCMLLLAACRSIDYSTPPPADFPKLAVTVHEFDGMGANEACREKYVAAGYQDPVGIVACIEANFRTRTCDIYVPRGNAYWLSYERAKCQGYGSDGEPVTIADKWKAFPHRR